MPECTICSIDDRKEEDQTTLAKIPARRIKFICILCEGSGSKATSSHADRENHAYCMLKWVILTGLNVKFCECQGNVSSAELINLCCRFEAELAAMRLGNDADVNIPMPVDEIDDITEFLK